MHISLKKHGKTNKFPWKNRKIWKNREKFPCFFQANRVILPCSQNQKKTVVSGIHNVRDWQCQKIWNRGLWRIRLTWSQISSSSSTIIRLKYCRTEKFSFLGHGHISVSQYSNENNSFNKLFIPNEYTGDITATTRKIHKGKKLNYIASVNPSTLYDISGTITDLGDSSGNFGNMFNNNSLFLAEFVIISRD